MPYQVIIRDIQNDRIFTDERVENLEKAIQKFWDLTQNFSGNKVNFMLVAVPVYIN